MASMHEGSAEQKDAANSAGRHMTSDDIELLAYVDGALSTHEREAVERKLAASSDMALRVEWIEASDLPYAQAFAQQRLPPVPASLERMIGGIAQAARLETQTAARKREPVASGWIAAAFLAGALACAFAFALVCGAALHLIDDKSATADTTAPWVQAAVRYQQLYSRATLADIDADLKASNATLARIRRDDALAISIPDLSAYGLTFKRVQRLQFNGRALVQIVYLPERGEPVALCVMRETQADAQPKHRAIESMAVITWRRAQAGYALIGASDDTRLDTLARHISDGDAHAISMPNELKHASTE
jgi:anti-sigma factor RsiW